MLRYLVLGRADDALALDVHLELLAQLGDDELRFVSDDELVYASTWRHELERDRVRTTIELADGTWIDSKQLLFVFNRLLGVPEDAFAGTPDPDLSYARMETHALWLSWLSSLPCPVINRAGPRGMCGPDMSESEWLARAARCGLPVRRSRLCSSLRRLSGSDLEGLEVVASPKWPWFEPGEGFVPGLGPALLMEPIDEEATRSTLIVGDTVVGPHAGLWGERLDELARSVGCDLLEVLAAPRSGHSLDPDAWCFCGARVFPVLRDPAFVRAIAGELVSLANATMAEERT